MKPNCVRATLRDSALNAAERIAKRAGVSVEAVLSAYARAARGGAVNADKLYLRRV